MNRQYNKVKLNEMFGVDQNAVTAEIPQVKKRKKHKKRTVFDYVTGIIVELCLVTSILIAGFLGWQIFWTSYQVSGEVDQAITQFQSEHPAAPPSSDDGQVTEPTHHTDAPPAYNQPSPGEIFGVLHIPSWDYMRTPLASGVGAGVLDHGYAGWYDNTQLPGEVGNFATAGHRRTYGNNFRYINHLQNGDQLVVETDNAYIVYEVFNHEIVTPDQVNVIAPVPNHPEMQPTERLITLTTCNSGLDTSDYGQYGNSHRWITYGRFLYWTDKSEGKPSVIVDETNANPEGKEI